MDSFSEPYTREGDDVSLDRVHAKIRQLEEEHRKNGIALSGRIIHVVHSLPLTATYEGSKQRPGAPPTPPLEAEDAVKETPAKSTSPWTLQPRFGHAAMISGIMSLSATNEQVIVGWTGDILAPSAATNTGTTNTSADRIPSSSFSQEDKKALEAEIRDFQPADSDHDMERTPGKTTYVPVWLDDKVAHGHYDGYCKQSTRSWFLYTCTRY
jgi:trehalose 6-phosphate synthase/phosphatase